MEQNKMEKNKLLNSDPRTSGFFSMILEKLKVASVFVLNKQGLILDINTGVNKAFGYTHEDVIGKSFSLLFTDEDRKQKKPETELETVLKEGSAMDHNYIVSKNGDLVWVHGESIYIEDESGQPYIIKVVFDTERQKSLERELQEKNVELEKINKDLDTFVYTASHDLKAPISNIEALIVALFDELSEDSKKKKGIIEIMEMLNVSLDKFKTTLNDLSAVGRSVAGKADEVEEVKIKDILEDAKMNLQEKIEEISPVFTEDFSHAPEIRFSAKNLRSIMQNLISNAIKYHSPKRAPEINVLTKKINEHCVLLQVSDNGLGIKDEDKEKIFSMYKRLHNHVEGTGVGLTIIKRIIDNNGGKIEVESEVDKGTTFKVFLKC